MATTEIHDFRRNDLRTNVLENPYWITSAKVDFDVVRGMKDKSCLLFSFADVGVQSIIQAVAIEIITGCTASVTLDIGLGTLATPDITTGGDLTTVDDDEFIPTASITEATPGIYFPATGDFVTARAGGLVTAGTTMLVGAATTVPAVAAYPKVAAPIAGQFKVHMLICNVP